MERFENVLETVEDKAKYFTKITAEDREKVRNWLVKQEAVTKNERDFLGILKEAIRAVKYDYRIANLEPSVEDGKIYYAEGNDAANEFSCNQWELMAKAYWPEEGARLSNLYELFIWYALRIVNGLWTLDYVANDSSAAGNYWNAPGATRWSMEKTGARECGGYRDGQGNTCKVVTHEGRYVEVGGIPDFRGDEYPVADWEWMPSPDTDYSGSGVLVLTK